MPKETKTKRRERLRIAKERSTCSSGKIQYGNERDANRVLLSMWYEGRLQIHRPYECPECGKWHLTKNKSRSNGNRTDT